MANAEIKSPERAALARIEHETDPGKLRTWIEAGRREGVPTVERAAFTRLCFVQPEATPGTVEHDVWQSIHALEEILKRERGKTVRLSRTRQKIGRDGEAKTASDLTLKSSPSEGYLDLVARGMPELTFEAVVLRHPRTFGEPVLNAARTRLSESGIDLEALTQNAEGA